MKQDELNNLSIIQQAIAVVPSDDEDLTIPGLIFIDEDGTEGVVVVDLMFGGKIKIKLNKGNDVPYYYVKKVYATDITAAGIFVNPVKLATE